MAAHSREITLQRFGRTTQLYAPLYLSNLCTNNCAYCGFSAGNTITRRKLTIDEAEQEAMILQERGFQHVLLVSGEASAALGVEYLEEIALRLRDRFAALSIEVQPLEQNEYARLFRAGRALGSKYSASRMTARFINPARAMNRVPISLTCPMPTRRRMASRAGSPS